MSYSNVALIEIKCYSNGKQDNIDWVLYPWTESKKSWHYKTNVRVPVLLPNDNSSPSIVLLRELAFAGQVVVVEFECVPRYWYLHHGLHLCRLCCCSDELFVFALLPSSSLQSYHVACGPTEPQNNNTTGAAAIIKLLQNRCRRWWWKTDCSA